MGLFDNKDLQALKKELADAKHKLAEAQQQLQEVLLVNERLVQEVELMSEKQKPETAEQQRHPAFC
jgi:hypothetical protein